MPRKKPEPVIEKTEIEAEAEDLLNKPVRIGRRPILEPNEETLKTLGELAKLFCTQAEAAGFLGVAIRTFTNFLTNHEVAKNVWEDGLQHAKISLRRKQLALADKNAPAAIFLGKNYLGQKDEHHTTTTVAKPAAEMSEAELLELARSGQSAKQEARSKAH
jgi:hypothetical protein